MKWNIKALEQEKVFEGLGQLKNVRLPTGTVVISHENGNLLAVPGLSGSQKTSVDSQSRRLLLEVANFDGEEVSRNSSRLNYRSDASKIFAGGISPFLTNLFIVRLTQILNKPLHKVLTWTKDGSQDYHNSIKVDFAYLSSRLDARPVDYWQPILTRKLKFLGKFDSQTNTLKFNRFYQRIGNQDELLVELIRMIGFDNLEPQSLSLTGANHINPVFENLNQFKNSLLEFGFDEVITRPFVSENEMYNPQNGVKLLNPSSSLQPYYRDNLLGSLLNSFSVNLNRGEKDVRIFEINKIYSKDEKGLLIEKQALCMIWSGEDPYLGTTIVNQIIVKLKTNTVSTVTYTDNIGQVTEYLTMDNKIEEIKLTQLSNKIKKKHSLPLNKVIWSISLNLPTDVFNIQKYKKYRDQSDFPNINRSFSIQIPSQYRWKDIAQLLSTQHINDCMVEVIPKERIKITNELDKLNFNVRFVSYTRTLQSSEIEDWEQKAFTSIDNAS